jgi:Tfp pilus assembly protein PilN
MRAVNLIPSDSRMGATPGAGRSGGTAYAVLAVLGGLAVLALLYGRADRQVSSRRSQAASLSARAQHAQAEAERLAPYASFVSMREARMQAVSDLVDARFDWAHAFHELGRVLPRDASISSLDGTIGGSVAGSPAAKGSTAPTPATSASASSTAATAATSATPPGSVPAFTLSGCATSQSEVALTLARLRLIDGVSEVTLQSSTKSGAAGSAGASASAGSCPGNDPAFSIQVAFAPLPSSAVIASATKLTSATGAGR